MSTTIQNFSTSLSSTEMNYCKTNTIVTVIVYYSYWNDILHFSINKKRLCSTQKNFAFSKWPPQKNAKKLMKNRDFFCHAKILETLDNSHKNDPIYF